MSTTDLADAQDLGSQFGSRIHLALRQQRSNWYSSSDGQCLAAVSQRYVGQGHFRSPRDDILRSDLAGLLTNVGMVVANAAYDSNTTNIAVFDETAYHGAVVWSVNFGDFACRTCC